MTKKKVRVIIYLIGDTKIPLIMDNGNVHVVKWWVDISSVMHSDMNIHTDNIMSLGKGSI